MSSIYATTISSEKYIIINSQNIELSGNVIMKEHVTISNGLLNTNSVIPNVTNNASLGSTSSSWSNAYIRDLSVNNNLQVTGNVYISENLDVSNIYTKNYIDNSFANVYTRSLIDSSFANVYTRSHIDQSFQNVYTRGYIDQSFSNVYSRGYIDQSFQNVYTRGVIDSSFQNVYTRIQFDNSYSNVYTRILFDNSYSNVYTRGRIDQSFANVYTRGYLDQSFANVYTRGRIDQSFANVYTRIQVDNSFAYKHLFDASYNALAIGGGSGSTSSIDLSLVSSNIIPLTTNNVNLGSTSKYWNNAYINNLRLSNRAYQEISGDISWSAVNGYYGLAKDAYPSLNPRSSGVLAVKTWTSRRAAAGNNWYSVCWSPELRLFVAIAEGGANKVMISSNGINWISRTAAGGGGSYWQCVCWSPQLRLFVALGTVNNSTTDVRAMFSSDGVSWSPATSPPEPNLWRDVCWSPELGLFLAVANGGSGTNRIAISSNGKNWTGIVPSGTQAGWYRCCWSPQLRIFVIIAGNPHAVIISSNGTTWSRGSITDRNWSTVCWSPELGIFLAVSAGTPIRVTTSSNGITWTDPYNIRTTPNILYTSCCWSSQLGLFVAVFHDKTYIMYSHNGINWTFIETGTTDGGTGRSICWSPELGIFVSVGEVGTQRVMTSSLKGRPPTSYNVFDSSFNRIDETGKWDFSNIDVTTLNVTGTFTNTSDDRLKHNEVIIANGLEIIDKLNPKFYQKTQTLLDASYNGDLSGQTWTYEAGLIAQEVLQVPDLSFVVCGGDYYQESYILKNQRNDISSNYYDISRNYYDISANYYDISANNYEISYNLITQPYSLNYNSIIVYGLAAIKELHAKVKAQDLSLLTQHTIINSLTTRMQALENYNQV
jgi:hypothetical protein